MKFRTFILAGASALMLATPALAGEGWYLGLGAGWDTLNGPKMVGAGIDGKLSTSDSAIVSGTVGYKIPDSPFRFEIESDWDRHDTHDFETGGLSFPSSGHAEVRSVMLNGLYDFHVLPRLKLSIGGGAGAGSDRIKFDNPFGTGHFTSDQTPHFMWQAIGGLTYEATPNVDLFVEYHFRDLEHPDHQSVIGPLGSRSLTEHVVMAGFRWYPWQEEEAAPPPPPPAPPPPPPPPAAVRTFIVFFDFNKSNLTSEAESVVAEAVKTAQTSGPVRIVITGHTDTVGSDSYNQALSQRRADTVKSQMITDGLSGDEISTVGKSFHDPLVPTGPNVREPQNRRAVIDLGGNGS
jgi:outer membrane protein OmpA-like peptidoglycan-associated protein/opacity protein-like surface antigen